MAYIVCCFNHDVVSQWKCSNSAIWNQINFTHVHISYVKNDLPLLDALYAFIVVSLLILQQNQSAMTQTTNQSIDQSSKQSSKKTSKITTNFFTDYFVLDLTIFLKNLKEEPGLNYLELMQNSQIMQYRYTLTENVYTIFSTLMIHVAKHTCILLNSLCKVLLEYKYTSRSIYVFYITHA